MKRKSESCDFLLLIATDKCAKRQIKTLTRSVLSRVFFFSADERKVRSLLILHPHKLIFKAARSICSACYGSPPSVVLPSTDGDLKRKEKYKALRKDFNGGLLGFPLSTSRRTKKCLPSLAVSLARGLSNRFIKQWNHATNK